MWAKWKNFAKQVLYWQKFVKKGAKRNSFCHQNHQSDHQNDYEACACSKTIFDRRCVICLNFSLTRWNCAGRCSSSAAPTPILHLPAKSSGEKQPKIVKVTKSSQKGQKQPKRPNATKSGQKPKVSKGSQKSANKFAR